MKCKGILTLFLLLVLNLTLLSPVSARRLRRGVPVNNKYYRLYYGIVTRIVGSKEKNLSECLPPSWLNKDPEKDDIKNVISSLTAVQSVISKVMVVLNKRVEIACKDKTYVLKYLQHKLHVDTPKSAPAKKRLFLQVLKGKKNNARGFNLDKISPFDSIVIYIGNLVKALGGFFDLPILKQAVHIFKCIPDKYSSVKNIKDISKYGLEKIDKIQKGGKHALEVLVESMCNWHRFSRSIHFLNAAIKQANSLTMWQGFGYFVGRLFSAIANQ